MFKVERVKDTVKLPELKVCISYGLTILTFI